MSANSQNTAISTKPNSLPENNKKSNPALSLIPSSSPEPLLHMSFSKEEINDLKDCLENCIEGLDMVLDYDFTEIRIRYKNLIKKLDSALINEEV